MTFRTPTLRQALEAYQRIEGHRPVVADLGALESAFHRPTSVVFGVEAYPTIHEKAAALLDAINRNHALVDGNKRLSLIALFMIYRMNGYLNCLLTEDERYNLVLRVADVHVPVPDLAQELSRAFVADSPDGRKA